MRLSKSRYLMGLQCLKRLWWTVKEPEAPELRLEGNAVALERGNRVGELARGRVPGGVLIDLPHREIAGRVAATEEALRGGAGVVYEASFEAGGVFVSVDILERRGAGFVLTEVKSSLDVKSVHLPDVALQTHVLRAAGIALKRVEVMHLNRECEHPRLEKLFVRQGVTQLVRPLLEEVPERLDGMAGALDGPVPEVSPGAHCHEPYACPFLGRCWPALPEHHVSTLYRISRKKADKLTRAGFQTLHDLPEDFRASPPARRQIRSARAGELIVEPGLREALAEIEEPIAFLDFETIMPAVPAWHGCRPYQQVPVQLSCHVLVDGGLEHRQWLADGPSDPRAPFAEALLAACEGARTIVAYNAPFELKRIETLVGDVPSLGARLKKLQKRVVDLLPIVRDHVYHPAFHGSFSIKAVLPALVSSMGYDDLEVRDGATASALLEALLLGDVQSEEARIDLRRNLLGYCERDTLAMVKLYERLGELAGGE